MSAVDVSQDIAALTLRVANPADLPAVLGLYAQPGMDDETLSVTQAEFVLAEFSRYPSYRLFVACEADGSIVGTYALLIMHNLAHNGAPSAVVEDVVVIAGRRGQGIGRQMMAHAIAEARVAGCYKLALSSNAKRVGAHAFYESLGFAQHGLSFVIEP
ncbi:GNAT family N-acetyltransferase [Pigmentiphaga aceris]|uniref:GNAT family N-acetyltransferase n=1 Tax=Pigmentiphaga aceris TaxID=1940612 RepID=A0A5C0AXR2_9BURK|nr:GNAT family N-acetyltransferase [Pigmentiphaga aceris]QEI06354.1 GNAT family N-acetyltransferase [Pigmentiphaga aceris]